MNCNPTTPSNSSDQNPLIQVTSDARTEIKRLLEAEGQEGLGLRLGIQGGGCSGLTYYFRFSNQEEGDTVVDHGDFQIFLNPQDLQYLRGVSMDFQGGLAGRGFKIHNPNAVSSCGCGESFSRNPGASAPGASGCGS